MEGKDQKKRIAIFCQGGGSHTAFTAGALKKLLTRGQARYDFVAFSGTSGGAICALLAWYGSLTGSPEKAVDLLDVFWKRDKSANTSPERIFNDWLVNSLRWHQETGFLILQSPNFYSELAQDQLRRAIERNVGFDEIDERLMKPESPMLFIGAVDVLTGSITTFRSHRRVETDEGPRFVFNQDPDTGITAQAVLASAAIPPIFGRCASVGAYTGTACFPRTLRYATCPTPPRTRSGSCR